MSFEFKKLPIDGAYLIFPHIYVDNRGEYKKVFSSEEFKKHSLPIFFDETSDIISQKGSIRGLHFQSKNSQAKLLHVIKGSIYDAFIDLRPDSKTYLKHFEIQLNDKDDYVLFIPEGCAHGFMALEDNTIFSYQCTNKYQPECCGGIIFNDPSLGIKRPLTENLVITDKDKSRPTLEEFLHLRSGEND